MSASPEQGLRRSRGWRRRWGARPRSCDGIGLIAGMIKQVAVDRQVIVATQSPQFVDAFDLDEIVVMDLRDGRTVCRTLGP